MKIKATESLPSICTTQLVRSRDQLRSYGRDHDGVAYKALSIPQAEAILYRTPALLMEVEISLPVLLTYCIFSESWGFQCDPRQAPDVSPLGGIQTDI